MSDWLNTGNTVEELPKIVEATPEWASPTSSVDTPDRLDDAGTLLSDVVEEQVE